MTGPLKKSYIEIKIRDKGKERKIRVESYYMRHKGLSKEDYGKAIHVLQKLKGLL
jgi:rRNA processing protein Gar1